ncbi:tetratricopeptide repeat protein [Sandaracinobacteroides saxicola]|uniref:Tetratricopeptide repeat protein n=1 Tax=Sandaracinobacteroides saxicola TaxID=2759707 RepID=A0A7G5IF53_9SPHN|nr:tetratricopeptide repeat protein [Sandaracinobacteroides saxicola]QMW21995.1 tetratricopeptide repeat protein [Sandaracinobacteroides saxicola]
MADEPIFTLGSTIVDPAGLRVTGADGVHHSLQPRTMQVLVALFHQAGTTVSRESLNQSCWEGRIVGEDAIDRVLVQLRKLAHDSGGFHLETIRGVGVRLLAQAATTPAPAPAGSPPPATAAAAVEPLAAPVQPPAAPTAASVETPLSWWKPLRLYVAGLLLLLVAAGAWWALRPAGGNADAVLVLPFQDMSPRRDQAWFANGVAEEILSALSRDPRLRVMGRTTGESLRARALDLATLRAQLGVGHVLEGSLRQAGGRIRVAVRLIDTRDGTERWTESFDRPDGDIFAVQDEIAQAVASRLGGTLDAVETRPATRSVPAHDALLRGQQLVNLSGDEATWRAALAQFDAAIRADPDYAAAHAARAGALSAIAGQFDDEQQAPRRNRAALEAAQTAVRLAPDLADAHAALAYVLERGQLDVRGAARAYDRAYALAQGDPDLLIRFGIFNVRVGDATRGLAALQRASALDPYNPRAWRALGTALYQSRRFADSIPAFDSALRLSPGMAAGHAYRGDALLMLGRVAEARASYAAETTGWAQLAGLAIVEARSGNRPASDSALASLRRIPGAGYQVAQVLAQRGEAAAALAMLETAHAARDPGMLNLRNDPMLDPLRGDPRFRALLARLGIG